MTFVDQIRKLTPGTLQNQLDVIRNATPDLEGGESVGHARTIGDHAAGLSAALSTFGLISLDKALIKVGRASDLVRKGTTLVLTDDGKIEKIPVLDPHKSRLLNS